MYEPTSVAIISDLAMRVPLGAAGSNPAGRARNSPISLDIMVLGIFSFWEEILKSLFCLCCSEAPSVRSGLYFLLTLALYEG